MLELASATTRPDTDPRPVPSLDECAVVVLADATQAIQDAVKAGNMSGWRSGYTTAMIATGFIALVRGWTSDTQAMMDFGAASFAAGLILKLVKRFRFEEVTITMPHWSVADFAARWLDKINGEVKGG